MMTPVVAIVINSKIIGEAIIFVWSDPSKGFDIRRTALLANPIGSVCIWQKIINTQPMNDLKQAFKKKCIKWNIILAAIPVINSTHQPVIRCKINIVQHSTLISTGSTSHTSTENYSRNIIVHVPGIVFHVMNLEILVESSKTSSGSDNSLAYQYDKMLPNGFTLNQERVSTHTRFQFTNDIIVYDIKRGMAVMLKDILIIIEIVSCGYCLTKQFIFMLS